MSSADPKVFSTEAIAYATLQLVHGILHRLIECKILTEGQVAELFDQAVASQRASPLSGNQEAAALLSEMAKKRNSKFR
jgi:hypothetical protein